MTDIDERTPQPDDIPPEDWITEKVFDSADYLDGNPPGYAGRDGVPHTQKWLDQHPEHPEAQSIDERTPQPDDIPMEDWIIEKPFDSSEYLDGPPPRYAGQDGEPHTPEWLALQAAKKKAGLG